MIKYPHLKKKEKEKKKKKKVLKSVSLGRGITYPTLFGLKFIKNKIKMKLRKLIVF